jgi:quinol monooxygenase YgiN
MALVFAAPCAVPFAIGREWCGKIGGETDVMVIAALVEFWPAQGREADVERVLRAAIEPCRAEAGSLRYDVSRRRCDGVFVLYEAYRDMEAVEVHTSSAHCARYREDIGPLLARPIEPTLLDPIEGVVTRGRAWTRPSGRVP